MKRENTMPAGRQDNFDDVMYDSLEHFEVTPSVELKKRIMKDMFLVNLLKYHLYKIIGGFVGIAVLTVAIVYVANLPEKNSVMNNPVQTMKNSNIKTSESISSENENNPTVLQKNNNNIVQASLNNQDIINNTQKTEINKQTALQNPNLAQNITYNNKQIVNQNIAKNINTPNKLNKQNEVQNVPQNSVNNQNLNDNGISGSNSENYNNPINTSRESGNADPGLLANKNTSSDLSNNDAGTVNTTIEKINFLISKSPFLPSDLSGPNILKDTFYNYKGDEIILKTKFYALDVYWSGFLHQSVFTAANAEAQDFTSQRSDALISQPEYSCFGLNFTMYNKHFLLQAGISMIKIQDNFKYSALYTNPRQEIFMQPNNNPYNYIHNGNYFLIDTPGGYWHYTYVSDSMIHIKDSVWQNIIDTNLVNIYDSTLKTVYDTLKNKKLRNTYSYFEIPIIVGYEVSYGKFDVALKGGIITSFIMSTNLAAPVINSNGIVPVGSTPPIKGIFFSSIVSTAVHYNITDQWGVYTEPYYRRGLTDFNVKNGIFNQRVNVFGIRFGVRYKF